MPLRQPPQARSLGLRRSLHLHATLQKTTSLHRGGNLHPSKVNKHRGSSITPKGHLKDHRVVYQKIQSHIRIAAHLVKVLFDRFRTYQRFICRLFETIALYQLKYQGNSTS